MTETLDPERTMRDESSPAADVSSTRTSTRLSNIGRRAVSRRSHLWPLLVMATAVLVLWGRPVLTDFGGKRLSNPGDSESFAYYLSWNVHALFNLMDPFHTPNLYAPGGLDLGNAISIPSVSLLVSPVAIAFGGTAAYNAAFLLAIFFCGVAIYLLARELFGSVIGATAAGLLATVSPYFTAHALGHLNLMWVFGLPLVAYLTVRAINGRLRPVWLAVGVALTVGFTAGASTELLVTEALFVMIALCVSLFCANKGIRTKLLRLLPWLAAGVFAGAILAIPVVLAALRSGIPHTPGNPPQFYSTEWTNVFVPTSLVRFGAAPFAAVRQDWLGNEAENSAYVPLSLLLLLLVYARYARGRVVAALGIFAAIAFIASLGPFLTIDGKSTLAMPWGWAILVPGLDHALPVRFTGFVFMALALFVAHAWSARVVSRWATALAVVITGLLLVPSPAALGFPTDAHDPPFVTSGQIRDEVAPGENVLVLPAGQWGPGMRWQDDLDFSFDMPTGNGGGANTPPALRDPVGRAFFTRDMSFDFVGELPAYLRRYGVDTVLIDARYPVWKGIVDRALHVKGDYKGGVWVYDLQ